MEIEELNPSIKSLRALEATHGISLFDLDNPNAKLTLDFLVDLYFEGSRGWDSPPEKEAVEDLGFFSLLKAVKSMGNAESG